MGTASRTASAAWMACESGDVRESSTSSPSQKGSLWSRRSISVTGTSRLMSSDAASVERTRERLPGLSEQEIIRMFMPPESYAHRRANASGGLGGLRDGRGLEEPHAVAVG